MQDNPLETPAERGSASPTPTPRVLLVDDDPAFCHACSMALAHERIEHVVVGSPQDALRALSSAAGRPFDLILLDMELPGMRGTELLKLLRERGRDVPIVFVSVIATVEEKVRAFDLGADDYIVKPFAFEELVTRLQTVLRRAKQGWELVFGDLEIDAVLRRARGGGGALDLAPREFELLRLLAERRGAFVAAEELVERMWKADGARGLNSLRVNASRLKQKLARATRVQIDSLRGRSYRLVQADASAPGVRP